MAKRSGHLVLCLLLVVCVAQAAALDFLNIFTDKEKGQEQRAQLEAEGTPYLLFKKARLRKKAFSFNSLFPSSVFVRCSQDGGQTWITDNIELDCINGFGEWAKLKPPAVVPWESSLGDTLYCEGWQKEVFSDDIFVGDTIIRVQNFQRNGTVEAQDGGVDTSDLTDDKEAQDEFTRRVSFIDKESENHEDWITTLQIQISCHGCQNASILGAHYWSAETIDNLAVWPSQVTTGCMTRGLKAAILLQQGKCCPAESDYSTLGDNTCNEAVNVESCGWDFGDCCPPDSLKECELYSLGDGLDRQNEMNETIAPALEPPSIIEPPPIIEPAPNDTVADESVAPSAEGLIAGPGNAPATETEIVNGTETSPQDRINNILDNLTPADAGQFTSVGAENTTVIQMADVLG